MSSVLYLSHSVTYSNKNPLPVNDVIDSLQAMRRISSLLLPSTLGKLTGSEIVSVSLLVDGLEYGSFKENFWLQFVFKDENALKRFQQSFREADWAGMYRELPFGNKPMVKTIAIPAVIAALVSGAVYWYVSSQGSLEERALIEANNNTIIAIGAEAYRLDPEFFRGVIEAAAGTRRKELVTDAAKILAPAHNEPGATVTLGDAAVIPSDVVRSVPREVTFEQPPQWTEYGRVTLDIRQTNRDSAKSGWKARIPNVVEDRVKLSFGEGVVVDDLAVRLSVEARVIVVTKFDERRNQQVPVEIVVLEVLPPRSNEEQASASRAVTPTPGLN